MDSVLLLILPYFLLMTGLMGAAALCARAPFYRELLAAPTPRYPAIEGLRGFLALAVFFHHVAAGYMPVDSFAAKFYLLLGQVGVSLFFCITGFLFWSKAIAQEGKFDLKSLYLGRVWRLAPAYLLSVLLVALVLLLIPGAELSEPHSLFTQFFHVLPFKGIKGASEINGIYWTLVYEWKFYLALPLLAFCWRGWKFAALIAGAVMLGLSLEGVGIVILNFVTGALCAFWHSRTRQEAVMQTSAMAGITLVSLGLVFIVGQTAYALLPILLMGAFFCAVVYGNNFFGLLETKAARLLGMLSYSTYLLHSILLFIAQAGMKAAGAPVLSLAPGWFWLWVAGMELAVLAASLLSYRFVEWRFLHGKKATA